MNGFSRLSVINPACYKHIIWAEVELSKENSNKMYTICINTEKIQQKMKVIKHKMYEGLVYV